MKIEHLFANAFKDTGPSMVVVHESEFVKVINFNFWGGSEIDLNDAVLSTQHTEIRVISIMGGADVYVPEGLDVQVSQFALMGGNDVKLGRGRPVPGGPTVHLRLFSLMGGSDVKRGRKLSRRERRELKEQRRAQRRIDRGE